MTDGFVADTDGFTEDPRQKTGPWEALGRGAVQGATLRFGDEITGLARAGLEQPLPQQTTPGPRALAKLYPGVPYPEAAQRWFAKNRPDVGAAQAAETARFNQGARYTGERDKVRAANEQARADRPGLYLTGELAGGAATAPLTTPLGGPAPTLLGRVASGAKAAAPAGAAFGLGGSTSDSLGGQLLDTFIGGAGGALVGGAVPVLGAALSPVAQAAGKRLRSTAINQGRKVLTGNSAPMATRKPLSDEAVQAAYDVKAIRPGSTVEKAADVLSGAREAAGDRYAQIISQLEAQGVTGPQAQNLAAALLKEADAVAGNTLGSPTPGLFRSTAEELGTKPVDAAGNLALSQAENMKRTLQRAAQSEYVKEGSQSLAGEAKTEIASRVRQAIEDAVTAQAAKAPTEAAAFEPVKRQVGALIEASNAANRGAARAANRQQFGLGSKVLAGGALASGNVPGAVATMLGATALRNRGPATLGWLANKGANLMSRVNGPPAPIMGAVPAVSDEVAAMLQALGIRPISAAAEGDQ